MSSKVTVSYLLSAQCLQSSPVPHKLQFRYLLELSILVEMIIDEWYTVVTNVIFHSSRKPQVITIYGNWKPVFLNCFKPVLILEHQNFLAGACSDDSATVPDRCVSHTHNRFKSGSRHGVTMVTTWWSLYIRSILDVWARWWRIVVIVTAGKRWVVYRSPLIKE